MRTVQWEALLGILMQIPLLPSLPVSQVEKVCSMSSLLGMLMVFRVVS